MMLPTDMALKTDPVFAQHAAAYGSSVSYILKPHIFETENPLIF